MSDYTVSDKSSGDTWSATEHNAMKAALNSKQDEVNSPQTLTDGATITWNMASGFNAKVTLAGNRTLAISNAVSGDYGKLNITQDATGSRTITLPAGSKVIGGGSGAVTLTTTAAAIDVLTFFYDGTNYFWNIGKNYT